jgi:hypothetical protein
MYDEIVTMDLLSEKIKGDITVKKFEYIYNTTKESSGLCPKQNGNYSKIYQTLKKEINKNKGKVFDVKFDCKTVFVGGYGKYYEIESIKLSKLFNNNNFMDGNILLSKFRNHFRYLKLSTELTKEKILKLKQSSDIDSNIIDGLEKKIEFNKSLLSYHYSLNYAIFYSNDIYHTSHWYLDPYSFTLYIKNKQKNNTLEKYGFIIKK